MELYLHSLICLHGTVHNYISKCKYNFTFTFRGEKLCDSQSSLSCVLLNSPLNHKFSFCKCRTIHFSKLITYLKRYSDFECFQTCCDMGFRNETSALISTISVLFTFFHCLKLRIVLSELPVPPLMSVLLITVVVDSLIPLLCNQEAPGQTLGSGTSCQAVSCAFPSICPGKCSVRVLYQVTGASFHVMNNNHIIRRYVTYASE